MFNLLFAGELRGGSTAGSRAGAEASANITGQYEKSLSKRRCLLTVGLDFEC